MSEDQSSFYLELTRLLTADQISVRLSPASDRGMAIEAWSPDRAETRVTFPLADGEVVEENAAPMAERIRVHFADRTPTSD